jgi:hypothetical protein
VSYFAVIHEAGPGWTTGHGITGVVGEAQVDFGCAVCIHDQQRADASVFASGERSAEEDEALVCKRIHERCVIADSRLPGDPLPSCPGGSRFADDGEVAHDWTGWADARAMRKRNSLERL